ncbi:MAG: PEP-CTERM sorting domain-containing protein [Gemmatimonadetes bacterium]|nr:PEP-CTERM sorting domain-containing protein [Gemmatimonadota bacterium]
MRKLVLVGLTAGLVGGAMPAAGQWNFVSNGPVCASPLDICVDFQLSQGSTSWVLTTTVTGSYGGLFHVVGLYSLDGAVPGTGIIVTPADWSTVVPPDQLNEVKNFVKNSSMDPPEVFELGAAKGTASYQVTISFDPPLTANGTLVAAAHVGSVGTASCSLKFGSWGEVLFPDGGSAACGSSVPEPVSLILLGSGLLGVGGMRMRRRHRKQ